MESTIRPRLAHLDPNCRAEILLATGRQSYLPPGMDPEEDPAEAARRRLARKRPREQLNCSECYRRKQKCE